MKGFVLFLFLFTSVFAKVDYSQMSNEELIALIGYVTKDKQKDFEAELNKRVNTFTEEEKRKFDESKNEKVEE